MTAPTPSGSGNAAGDNIIDRDSSGASSGGISNDLTPSQPARGGPTSHDWSFNAPTPPDGGVEQAYRQSTPTAVSPLGPGMRSR